MTDSAQNSKQILAQKGTAGTPGHSFLGGNTTGMYLAGTNQLGFSTAGAFAAVIDSSGNVGIGTASPANKLDVVVSQNSNLLTRVYNANAGSSASAIFNAQSNDGNLYMISNSTAGGGGSTIYCDNGTGQFLIKSYAAIPLAFGTSNAERMRIDSSGNVGIGVVPSAWANGSYALQVGNGASIFSNNIAYSYFGTNNYFDGTNWRYMGTGAATQYVQSNGASIWYYAASGTAGNTFAWQEAMRLNSNGDLYVGAAGGGVGKLNSFGGSGSAGFFENNGATEIINISNSSNTAFTAMRFLVNAFSTVVGSISCSTSATSFNTSSDYRLKNSVTPMTSGLAAVSALKPVIYKWNADNSNGEGFIAHELAEVIPLAVFGEKDAVDKDGKIQPQGVDYSKVVVHLVAAIQELAAKVAALEGK